jgi:hypothetical protein
VSRGISRAEEAEIASKLSGGNELVGKAEVASRFQTSNSSSVQTSRKAIVQTLFKELRDDADIEYVLVVGSDSLKPFNDVSDIIRESDPSAAAPATALERGALVEIEVTLDVDPVFKLGTIISEFLAMADEYPDMLGEDGRKQLGEAEPINKILQQLLAGLIPIRATATNFVVADVNGVEYVVRKDAIARLGVRTRPLEVVGVTEHIGYWKDIRRVLFSSARVTMLCRVARDGVHRTWTPVKLADLFREVLPTLVDQINEASRNGIVGLSATTSQKLDRNALQLALRTYMDKLAVAGGIELSDAEQADLALAANGFGRGAPSASAQRRAFAAVRASLEQKAGKPLLDADEDLVARQDARDSAGLSLFPGLSEKPAVTTPQPDAEDKPDDRLLDVEVVAIYW